MRKRGNKKKDGSSKNWRNWFFFNNKTTAIVLTFVFLFLLILLPFFTTGSAVNSSLTGRAGETIVVEEDGGKTTTTVISGTAGYMDLPVTWKWLDSVQWLQICKDPSNCLRKEIFIYIITLAITFVMLFDILTLTSIFSPWASGVIAGGMAIVAAMVGFIRVVTTWFITIGATMGIAAGFIEIGVSIVIFVGLVFASNRIAVFAAKRQAGKMAVKAIKGMGEAGAATTGLREFFKKHLK